MVTVCVKINRLIISIILVIVALSLLLLVLCFIKGRKAISPENYLKKMGYEFSLVDEKKIMIPSSFGENMQQYNKLQKSQGFNLKNYSGKVCLQKKYIIESTGAQKRRKTKADNKKYVASLIVYDNNVVGGDLQEQYFAESGPQKLDLLKNR